MPEIVVVEGDITNMRVDAIVNAANNRLLGGGGVDGAIHRAGGPEVLAACRELRATTLPDGLPTGDAVATTGGKLPARWVIHTVGPVYSEDEDHSDLLRSAYVRSLAVADSLGVKTIAFPLISAGAYGWPRREAVELAVEAILAAPTRADEVLMVAYDRDVVELMQRAVP